jgi:galactokinase/mevalonate kinase-like predicted kinase
MLTQFGGGIELTTFVGIPKGSGLGASSILGAVIMAVIRRMLARPPNQRELFHNPRDLLDPHQNGGATLLYYTGLNRLANNSLQQIVGGYLNRDRPIMAALAEQRQVARNIADAMSRKGAAAFGHFVNVAGEL